jgi:hypothetical protein
MADVRRGRGPYVVADDDLEEDAMGVVGESALGQLLARPAIWSDGVGAVGESFVLPAGTVTFLLSDIEGSTRLWEAAPDAMAQAVPRGEDRRARDRGSHQPPDRRADVHQPNDRQDPPGTRLRQARRPRADGARRGSDHARERRPLTARPRCRCHRGHGAIAGPPFQRLTVARFACASGARDGSPSARRSAHTWRR